MISLLTMALICRATGKVVACISLEGCMGLSSNAIESLAADAALKYARARVSIREAITTWQLAQLLNASVSGVRQNFGPAVIRPGNGCYGALYSRAAISGLLSEWNARPIPFPVEPLLLVENASAFLLERGVRLTPHTMLWYRSQRPHLAPPFIRISPLETGKARYARPELAVYAEARKAAAISQGVRLDLLKDSGATEPVEHASAPSDPLLTKREATALLKLVKVLKERAL